MHRPAGAPARGWILVVLGSVALLLHLALAANGGTGGSMRLVGFSLVAASAIPHSLAYLTLSVTFAISLLPGRDPLITALARKMYDPIPAAMVVYTRGATAAWACFFAAQLLTSLVLFLSVPIGIWSLFVNVLNLPLVVAMFAAEHAYRMVHLKDAPRHSWSDVLRIMGYVADGVAKGAARTGQADRRVR